ncbi:hypothetical protein SAMN04488137_2559 [Fictibacillus solisalsi]|uniref:Uncharacterized protein n=1 Tax=Fictibacillus solisalsi TaxID=459525 RepID=A0A1G9X4S9_9BACL|nr:hypothetical protein [Fictibacillus solisalsi]SDM91486.1 hypothetical protein SAMN04488137_2559 [Fictibacillus solisalsi]
MKSALQEHRLMIVKEINPTIHSGFNLPTILKLPVFMKSLEHKPPDDLPLKKEKPALPVRNPIGRPAFLFMRLLVL